MRVLVVSDSHGRNDDVKQVIKQVGKIDMFIHLGDIERGADYIESLVDCEVHMVAGNNDFGLNLPAADSFMIGDKYVFITHGHRFYVGSSTEFIKEYAIDNGYDVIMFGHTHTPYLEIDDEVTVLNPGSLSYPRQDGRDKTYMLIDVDREGELHYSTGVLRKSSKSIYPDFFG